MNELEPLTSPVSEFESLPDYRPVSRLAILSLFLAIASNLAFADPLLIIVPIGCVAVCVITLFRFSRNPTRMLGRTVTVIALVVSIVIGAWTSTRHLTRQRQLYREGKTIGQSWLELIRDKKFYEAHQLHLPQVRRAQPGTSLARMYEDPVHGQSNFINFQKDFLGKIKDSLDSESTIRWLSNVAIEPNGGQDTVVQRFAIDNNRDGRTQTTVFEVVMKRTAVPYLHESQWEIVSISDPTDG